MGKPWRGNLEPTGYGRPGEGMDPIGDDMVKHRGDCSYGTRGQGIQNTPGHGLAFSIESGGISKRGLILLQSRCDIKSQATQECKTVLRKVCPG
jgi:hypothetical protein